MSPLARTTLALLTLAVSPALKPSELVARRPKQGQFEVVGYVAKAYRCPPCPPGAMCKPCMRDNVVLSDQAHRAELYTQLAPGDVIIFADGPAMEHLELGKRYRVKVEVEPQSTTDRGMNDLKLLSSEPAPEGRSP